MQSVRLHCASGRCTLAAVAPASLLLVLLGGSTAASIAGEGAPRIEVETGEEGIRLSEQDHPVLFYRTRPAAGRESWRMDYIHPLWSLAGAVLTEDAPQDHVHHRGVFWAWRRILLDGVQVADGWVGEHLRLDTQVEQARTLPDGSAVIRAHTTWTVPLGGQDVPLVTEDAEIRAYPRSAGTRRVELTIGLRALRQGVALAGTADEKGYSGPSIRLAHPDEMDIASAGRKRVATIGPVSTGNEVEFTWRRDFSQWAQKVALSCEVDGKPWTSWILRQELSMQNCAWPGQQSVTLPLDHPVQMRLVITHD